ncbi:glycosyltransferase [Granulicella arctica]|uniref:Glycosyltransferase involved in cell wall biosynthesis n=1 Tax=Granulicella arctica TaxID=940613 RepID=A0A7Y9PE82_9BACT|nr:glycosyltransferase [Granulicella arctica]NYF78308.1 glycosyltransferase involved in cell wall biosynthesis [Granulicella arctica]
MRAPRVAYFPDSFHEVNGVAHTSRNFVGYAERHGLPFLCVRAGGRATAFEQAGELRTLELGRSRASVRMEKDLEFDALFWRHTAAIEFELKRFSPDIIHITGPSELGMFGAYFAWKMGVPLAASWHTNVHEYLARRMAHMTSRMSETQAAATDRAIENGTLKAATQFYRLAQVLFAPNAELCAMLETATGRTCHLMQRGVDTALFTPARRTRPINDSMVRLGYVGRLSVEKNIALLTRVRAELEAAGIGPVEFFIVGQGGDEETLRRELPDAHFAGVLRGEALAAACADMDVLVFPSHTDTFGNVVLEALASGVPAVVTPDGGPKYIVRDGETGFVVPDGGFAEAVGRLVLDRKLLAQFRTAARAYALRCSWDAVFDKVYAAYEPVLARPACVNEPG